MYSRKLTSGKSKNIHISSFVMHVHIIKANIKWVVFPTKKTIRKLHTLSIDCTQLQFLRVEGEIKFQISIKVTSSQSLHSVYFP